MLKRNLPCVMITLLLESLLVFEPLANDKFDDKNDRRDETGRSRRARFESLDVRREFFTRGFR